MHRLRHLRTTMMIMGLALHVSPVIGAQSTDNVTPLGGISSPTPPSAEELYATAQSQYAAGDLAGALETMQACYEATRDENLLFNLAQLHRELSHCAAALEHYQRYLDAAPNGEGAADAKRYAVALRQQCSPTVAGSAAAQPQPNRPPVTQPQPNRPPMTQSQPPQPVVGQPPSPPLGGHWNTVGWIAFGAGAIATAAAIYFSVETNRAKSDIENLQDAASSSANPDKTRIQERLDDFFRCRNLGFTFGTVAALAVGTGVYAWVFAAPKGSSETTAWSLTLSPNTLRVGYGVQF